ncbi:MAG: hypothetical protein C5B49_14730 [Bdellovibrio sp.]|nr:MAG: hypothetical protein C5B49_14730 [Bdellovibrio sp.]
MKFSNLIFAVLLSAAGSALAQETRMEKSIATHEELPIQGARVGLSTPMLTANGVSLGGIGVSIGYAYLPVQQVGFTSNFSYLRLTNQSTRGSGGMWRVDGNVGTAINSIFNVKGGVNLSNLPDEPIKLDPALGFQASVGVQATRNVGFDLAYVQTAQSISIFTLKESGAELGVHATF